VLVRQCVGIDNEPVAISAIARHGRQRGQRGRSQRAASCGRRCCCGSCCRPPSRNTWTREISLNTRVEGRERVRCDGSLMAGRQWQRRVSGGRRQRGSKQQRWGRR